MKYENNFEDNEFCKKYKTSCHHPFLFGELMLVLSVFAFVPIKIFDLKNITFYILLSTVLVLFISKTYIVMPVILKKQTSKIIKALNKNKITPENISPSERTELLKTINKKPVYASLLAGAVSLFSNIILFFVITFLFSDKGADTVFLIIPFLAVSLYESIDTFSYAYEICTEECKTLALGKLDDEMIHNENHFGVSIITFFVIHIILPFLGFASTLISIRLFQMKTGGTHFVFLLPLLVVQILFMLIFSFRYKENSIDEILSVTSKLKQLIFEKENSKLKIDSKIPFDLNLDISYTSFAISRYISDVTNFSNQVNETKEKLYEFSKSIKSEIEKTKTSVEAESHDITNVLSTMEKIDDAMSNIENNFSKVASTASNTLNHIQESSNLLELNIKQIEQITNANIDTISGIKDLSDQIESVWQVISTIDTITEKTRTIAFNAEIETSTLGETAENFHIVANEIRRLADSVTDSTLSIRNKITSIQHASDNLVITSEGGTEKIREESELFTTLEEKFEEIKLSAQVTDESTVLIKQFLDNQRNSLEELSKMLYSLNNNFENFRNCTTEVSSTNSQILNILKGEGNAE